MEGLQQALSFIQSHIHEPQYSAISSRETLISQAAKQFLVPLFSQTQDAQDLLSLAFKQVLVNILSTATPSAIDDSLFSTLFLVLDLVLSCSEFKLNNSQVVCDQTLPFILLEDLIDMLTIEGAVRLFDYLEEREGRLTEGMDPSKGKGLVLLRFCNELLRRLSKTKHTETCGRILLFLAMVFPLSERSGVNLRGDFNSENTTFYTPIGESEGNELSRFYNVFWGLQVYFSNPLLVLQSSTHFEKFKNGVSMTRQKFLELDATTSWSKATLGYTPLHTLQKRGRNQDMEIDGDSSSFNRDDFFPKFLTDRKLFELELQDITFRRQILLQMLIVIQFLLGFSTKERDRQTQLWEKYPPPAINKLVQFTEYNGKLDSEKETFLVDAKSQITKSFDALKPTPIQKLFYKTIITVLSHEKNWVKWKNEMCVKFEKEVVGLDDGRDCVEKRRKVWKWNTPSIVARNKNWVGTEELSKLWANGNAMESILQEKGRKNASGSFDEFIKELDVLVDEKGEYEEGIEPEYMLDRDPQFNWRAFRIASRHHMHLFSQITTSVSSKSLLLEYRNFNKPKNVAVTAEEIHVEDERGGGDEKVAEEDSKEDGQTDASVDESTERVEDLDEVGGESHEVGESVAEVVDLTKDEVGKAGDDDPMDSDVQVID